MTKVTAYTEDLESNIEFNYTVNDGEVGGLMEELLREKLTVTTTRNISK